MSLGLSVAEIVERDGGRTLPCRPEWSRIELKKVARVQNGYAFSSDGFNQTSGTPLIRIRDVKRGATETYFEGDFPSEYLVEPGALLVGMDGDFNSAIWTGPSALLNQRVCRIIPDSTQTDEKYLAYVLPPYLKAINDHTSSITVKHLSSRTVESIPIPLPSLDEQREIVAEIETQFARLDAAVASLESARTRLKRYRASVLKAACEGRLVPTEAELARQEGRDYETAEELLARIRQSRRLTNSGRSTLPAKPGIEHFDGVLPLTWQVVSLEEITSAARTIRYGMLMPKENVADGVLYVKVKDMKSDAIDLSSLHRTRREIADKYRNASLKSGDLLVSIRGTYGRVASVPPELEGGNITQDTARLAVLDEMDTAFMAAYLRSELSQQYFQKVAKGVAVKGVNIADLRALPIGIPPITEQRRIVSELERRLSILERMEFEVTANLKRAESLRQAILRHAFSANRPR